MLQLPGMKELNNASNIKGVPACRRPDAVILRELPGSRSAHR
jgi:hypothetical protein